MRIYSIITLVTLSLFLVNPALAAPSPSPTPNQSQKIADLKAKGDADTTTRITALATLVGVVNTATKLSADQKNTLIAEMQGQSVALASLKATIDADTDLATLRTDYSNIFKQHYIFAFYLPRTHRIIAADAQSDAISTLNGVIPKLAPLIQQAQQQGADVTAMQTALTDMQNKVSDASTLSSGVLTSLLPLTAAGYPGNSTTVAAANLPLQTASSDLKAARQDLSTIISGLKKVLSSVQ